MRLVIIDLKILIIIKNVLATICKIFKARYAQSYIQLFCILLNKFLFTRLSNIYIVNY